MPKIIKPNKGIGRIRDGRLIQKEASASTHEAVNIKELADVAKSINNIAPRLVRFTVSNPIDSIYLTPYGPAWALDVNFIKLVCSTLTEDVQFTVNQIDEKYGMYMLGKPLL